MPMRIVIINKSDSTGGAAIVSRRLMVAFRNSGNDARMLVVEKKTDSPFIEKAGSDLSIKIKFIWERLKIFITNGFNRRNLFKIDTGDVGLPLWKHPLVKKADVILINWVNQGMLSLDGIKKISELGKPLIWTMHDMWCMTGICHHAGKCLHFFDECGNCPLLSDKYANICLAKKIWLKKSKLYTHSSIAFVAVSSWLAAKGRESSLLRNSLLEIIPNTFNPSKAILKKSVGKDRKIRILFGAARLDDPIKGLDSLKKTSALLRNLYPDLAARLEIAVFGGIKDPSRLEGFDLPLIRLGILNSEDEIREAYLKSDILVSASSYETLPGTLVEAQAFGVIPVSFNQGGQSDIIDHKKTGFIAKYDDEIDKRAHNLTEGIAWAVSIIDNPDTLSDTILKMRKSMEEKFSEKVIVEKYFDLIRRLKGIS